jgi:metal-responsive CopG/Arc/MetJ family transcriptional regulator
MRKELANFGVVMPRQVLQKLDEVRGDIPRSKFIQRLAEKALRDLEERENERNVKLPGLKVGRHTSQAAASINSHGIGDNEANR